jgi:hypothetical protein
MTAKPEQATETVVVEEGKTKELKLNRNGLVELSHSKLGETAVVAESVPVWLEKGFQLKQK